jgi:hypothetical protein
MLGDASILQTDCGVIVGYGLVRLPKISMHGRMYKPPVLCHIVTERKQEDDTPADWEGGKYVATCINLKMDGYGATASKALRDMNTNIHAYISMLLNHYGHTHTTLNNIFRQDLTDPDTKTLWDKYILLVQNHPPKQPHIARKPIRSTDRTKMVALRLGHASNSINKTSAGNARLIRDIILASMDQIAAKNILHLQNIVSGNTVRILTLRNEKRTRQDLISAGMVGKASKNKARFGLSLIPIGS